MKFFITFADELMTELRVMKKDYDRAKYPGIKVVDEGIRIMSDIARNQSAVEFFQTVSSTSNN